MATATPIMSAPVPPAVEGVKVTLTRREALALVAIGGHIGGDPTGPRGDFEGTVNAVAKALDLVGYTSWLAAKTELGATVTSGTRIDPAK